MKSAIVILSILLSTSCHAMGSKRPSWQPEQERSFDNKIFWPCTKKQVAENEGLFCNQVCVKKTSNKCLEIKINVLDPKKEHESLFKSGMMLAPSKLILN